MAEKCFVGCQPGFPPKAMSQGYPPPPFLQEKPMPSSKNATTELSRHQLTVLCSESQHISAGFPASSSSGGGARVSKLLRNQGTNRSMAGYRNDGVYMPAKVNISSTLNNALCVQPCLWRWPNS